MTVKEALQAGANALDKMSNCCGCVEGWPILRDAVAAAGFEVQDNADYTTTIVGDGPEARTAAQGAAAAFDTTRVYPDHNLR